MGAILSVATSSQIVERDSRWQMANCAGEPARHRSTPSTELPRRPTGLPTGRRRVLAFIPEYVEGEPRLAPAPSTPAILYPLPSLLSHPSPPPAAQLHPSVHR